MTYKAREAPHTSVKPLLEEVGMTGFEPATTRPPDEYSNRAELHPALACLRCKGTKIIANYQMFPVESPSLP